MSVKGIYLDSPSGKFRVVDTIATPHPYCITPKHVTHAANNHGGILNEAAIKDAESNGARCGAPRCSLSLDNHEHALLVECDAELKDHDEEVQTWLKSIVDEATKNGYAGFAFKRGKKAGGPT